MKLDRKELKNYPNILSKEQLCKVAHMSKRTALFLLQNGIIPSVNTGKQTRCYKIKKKDIKAFFDELEVAPQKAASLRRRQPVEKKIRLSPYVLRSIPSKVDGESLRAFYTRALAKYEDILTLKETAEFTGYRPEVVSGWIKSGKLTALQVGRKFIIPKVCLIDWLSSYDYNHIEHKSNKYVYSLWYSLYDQDC